MTRKRLKYSLIERDECQSAQCTKEWGEGLNPSHCGRENTRFQC